MNLPLVSVIIPGYKSDYIVETIRSIQNQTYGNIEIIIIDDGSPYNLKKTLEHFIDEEEIVYIYQQNKKMAAARNNGIKNSTGELIAFIDDDDLWLPEKISKQVELFNDEEIGLVYCFAEGFDSKNTVTIPNFEIARKGKIFVELFLEDFICNSGVMVRKSCLDKVGLFNTTREYYGVDDIDLWTRITYQFEAGFVPEILVQLRLHDSRFSSNNDLMQQNDLNARQKLISDLNIPFWAVRKYYNRIYFELGFANRKRDKLTAIKYYLASFCNFPSLKPIIAIFKLPIT